MARLGHVVARTTAGNEAGVSFGALGALGGECEKPLYSLHISQLAGRQHGHVTREQLLALGLARQSIDHRIRGGKLIAVHAGVDAVGHVPGHAIARAAAAVLACGRSPPRGSASDPASACITDRRLTHGGKAEAARIRTILAAREREAR